MKTSPQGSAGAGAGGPSEAGPVASGSASTADVSIASVSPDASSRPILIEYSAEELGALIWAGRVLLIGKCAEVAPYPVLLGALGRSEQALKVEQGSCGSIPPEAA